jgi:hypothetical protein
MSRLFFLLLVGLTVGLRRGSIQWLVALTVLWQLGTVFLRAFLLGVELYFSPNLNVFSYLPISDEEVFKLQWGGFLRRSVWSAVDFTVLFSVLAATVGVGGHSIPTGVALGVVEWIFIVAMAVCLLAVGWSRLLYHAALFFIASTFGLVFFLPNLPRLCGWLSEVAYWVPPTGWLVYAMGISPSKGLARDLWPCLISGVVLAVFPLAYHRLRSRYLLSEERAIRAQRATVSGQGGLSDFPEMAAHFTESASEVATGIRRGELQAGLDWRRVPIVERVVWRLLTERERLLVDFLVAGNPRWTAALRAFFIMLTLVLAGCWLFPAVARSSFGLLFSFGAIYVLMTFAGQWRGFMFPRGAGAQSPFYALYPLGFWDLMRVVLKVNLVRFLFCAPLVLGAVWLVLGGLQLAPVSAWWTAIKFLVLGLVAQPLLAIAQVSPGTNDGQKLRVVLPAVVFFVVPVGSGILFAVAATSQVMAMAGAIAASASVAALFLYGRFFNQNVFDLVPNKTASRAPQ